MKAKATLYLTILLSFLYSQVDYATEIQPIFNSSCISCHEYGHNSGLNLTTYSATMTGGNSGSTIVAGNHANSELFNRITLPESAQGDMPPSGSLPESAIDLITQWIDEGALEIPEIDTPDIVINEFLASNDITNTDESGEYDDWLEIYNTGTESEDIGGLYLTDDANNLTKWIIPNGTVIQPQNFLLFWCDEDQEQGDFHTNFKLGAGGEFLALVNIDGETILDSITFGDQTDDVSYGRNPDGSETWEYFSSPTPGDSNIESLQLQNEIIPESFTVFNAYPNPFNPVTTLSYLIPIDGFVDVTIFDMIGRVIKNLVRSKQSYGYKSIKWNATDNQNQVVPAGVYVYKIEFGKFVSTRKMILLK